MTAIRCMPSRSAVAAYAEFRLRCRSGFQSRCAAVKADEPVRVRKSECAVAYRVHPYRGVFEYLFMLQKLARHQRYVIRARHMVRHVIVKPGRIFKAARLHAELLRPLVHADNKCLHAARHALRKSDRRIVRGGDNNALQKVLALISSPGRDRPASRPSTRRIRSTALYPREKAVPRLSPP